MRVRDDRMWGADFGFGIETYPGKGRNEGEPYVVMADLQSGSGGSHGDDLNLRDLRRGFRVESELNCLGCEFAQAYITPQTNVSDIERFNHFDFSCISAIFACKHPVDFAPEAWNQTLKDNQEQPRSEEQACGLPPPILARETNDVVLAKVLSLNDGSSPRSPSYQKVRVQVLETRKNGKDFRDRNEALFVPTTGALRPESAGDSAQLTVGKDYFFFFKYRQPNPDAIIQGTYLDACHVLANTPSNAASVEEGVAIDPSNGEPYNFRNEPYTEK